MLLGSEPLTYTIPDLCAALRLSKSFVMSEIRRGHLAATRLGKSRGKLLVMAEDLQAYLTQRKTTGHQNPPGKIAVRRVVIPPGITTAQWLRGREPSYMTVEITAERRVPLWRVAEEIQHFVATSGQFSPVGKISCVRGPQPFLAAYNALQLVAMISADLLGEEEVDDFAMNVALCVGERLREKLALQNHEGRRGN